MKPHRHLLRLAIVVVGLFPLCSHLTAQSRQLFAMGDNSAGQLGDGSTTMRADPTPVATEAVYVAAGDGHSLVVKADGSLWGMGANGNGQLGDGTGLNRSIPTPIASGVKQAAAGARHSLFVKNDGTLWAMGRNERGELGDGTTVQRLSPVQVATEVVAVAASSEHSLFLKRDGTLWTMGLNDYGQLGDGTFTDRRTPIQVASGVVAVAAGSNHSLFLKTDSSLWGMGSAVHGRLGPSPYWPVIPFPSPVRVASNVRQMAAGAAHTLFVTNDGQLRGLGWNSEGQLGDGTIEDRKTSVLIATDVAYATAGYSHSLFVKNNGTLWTVGANTYGQLGDGTVQPRFTPAQIATNVVAVAAGQIFSLFVQASPGTQLPTIASQPADQSVAVGQGATLTVAASGSGRVSFQWYRGVAGDFSNPIAGATDATYLTPALIAATNYWVRVNDGIPGVNSRTAAVTVTGLFAPFFAAQPTQASVQAGSSAAFSVSFSGAPAATCRWQRQPTGSITWSNLSDTATYSGTASANLTVAGVTLAMSGDQFRCVATNTIGSATSMTAELTAIQVLPLSKEIGSGGGTYQMAVETGGSWTLNESVDWLSPARTEGVGESCIDIVVAPNPDAADRTATIVLAGITHTVTQRGVGTPMRELWAAGDDTTGALGSGGLVSYRRPRPIRSDTLAVASALSGSFLLKADGTLIALGFMGSSSLAPIAGVKQVAASGSGYTGHLVKNDGTLWKVDGLFAFAPVKVDNNVDQVAPGGVLYLKTDGTVWTNGANNYGQIGDGTTTTRTTPFQVDTGAVAIAGGSGTNFYLKSDGTLMGMGLNTSGQLGDATTTNRLTPIVVATGVRSVATSGHTLILFNDATLKATGSNLSGQLGDGTTTNRSTPVTVMTGVRSMAAGGNYSMIVKADGTLWATGSNINGVLGDGRLANRSIPVQVASDVTAVFAGYSQTWWLKTDGVLWGVGANELGQLGDDYTTRRNTRLHVAAGVESAAAGDSHGLYVTSDGTLWTMGLNTSGQLGDGTTTKRVWPVAVAAGVKSVAAGNTHSLFLLNDGTVRAMGYNAQGQLGDGTTTSRSTPVSVATLSDVKEIGAGYNNSAYLKTNGSLWIVGDNSGGQLGDGSLVNGLVPRQLATGVRSFAVGRTHTLYVTEGGELWAVGNNALGQLGDGTTTARPAPILVKTGVRSVVAGIARSFILCDDGTVLATGYNNLGQLGDGTLVNRLTPVAIGSDAQHIVTAYDHSLLLTADHTAWGFGPGSYGQLANGMNSGWTIPMPVMDCVQTFAVGNRHSYFVTSGESPLPVSLSVSGPQAAVTVRVAESAVFAVVATGIPAPIYRWQRKPAGSATWSGFGNGATYSGAFTARLTITGATSAMSGDEFRCVVTNDSGPVTSAAATLIVHEETYTSFATWATGTGAAGGPTADPDGVGVANLLRYAFDLPPPGIPITTPVTPVNLTVDAGGTYLAVTIHRKSYAPDIRYVVESSADLINWTMISTLSAGYPRDVVVRDTVPTTAAARRFLRVRVEVVP